MEEDETTTETSRLLNSPSRDNSKPSSLRSIVAAFTIHLFLNIATNLALTPQTAILQDIVCKNYYSQPNTRNDTTHDCGIEPVQGEVAYVIGWEMAIENIPNMLLAVPFGALADRFGRKKILLLALFGMFMNDAWIRLVYWFPDTFPVRAVWLAGLWQSIGSGAATLSSITHALVANACPEEQRTSAFSQIRSAKLLSQLLFVPLGGALISFHPWFPMWVATGFQILGILSAIILVPSDHHLSLKTEDQEPLLHDTTTETAPTKSRSVSSALTQLSDWAVSNSRLVPLILSFFVFQLGEQAGLTLLLQYAAKRLHWTLSKASFLISVRAGVNMAALVVLVPFISVLLLRKTNISVVGKDKLIAQISGLLLVLGCGAVFLSSSPVPLIIGLVLISLGDVFAIPVRSLATALVDPAHLGILYTVIEVMAQCGLFIGQPMLASTFRWGLKLGAFWIGLPFLFAAAFFSLALVAVSTVPVARRS